jgi:hypothetical protein
MPFEPLGFMANVGVEPAKPITPGMNLGTLAKPRLMLEVRVPADVNVVTRVVPVQVAHKFDTALNGVMRQAKIDLTTARAGATLRNPGTMLDDDTCCCVRG